MARKKANRNAAELIIFIVMFILLPILGLYLLFQSERWKKVVGAICLVAGIGIWGYTLYDSVYLPKMEKKQEQENCEKHTYKMGCGIQVRLPSDWDMDDFIVENTDEITFVVYDKDSVDNGCDGRLVYVKCFTRDEAEKLRNEQEADFEFKYLDSNLNEYLYVYSVTSYYNTGKFTYPEREELFHSLEDDLVWGLSVIPVDRDSVEYSRD